MAFYIFIALALIFAAAILFVRSVLNAALCLIICLLSVAGLYIMMNSEFLAIVQILVYAGGILLLIIFGIMITQRHEESRTTRLVPALIMAFALLGLLWYGLQDVNLVQQGVGPDLKAEQIGVSMMTQYAAPFEVGGMLLLVSLIGAMITSSYRSRA